MFERSRRITLDDGRRLVIQYEGETFGWIAYVPGETKRPSLAATPLGTMILYLGPQEVPHWAKDVSEKLMRELAESPRYECDCCGYLTLLAEARYGICPVCGWEDDRGDNTRRRGGPDALSGPNDISLTEASENFRRFCASHERRRGRVRDPRPNEHPSED